MTNKQDLLKQLGFIDDEVESHFRSLSFDKKVELLQSEISIERTLGASLLKGDKTEKTVKHLITTLKIEKKFYPKIEMCNS